MYKLTDQRHHKERPIEFSKMLLDNDRDMVDDQPEAND